MMIPLCFAKLAGFHGFDAFPGSEKTKQGVSPQVRGDVSDGGDKEEDEEDEVFRE